MHILIQLALFLASVFGGLAIGYVLGFAAGRRAEYIFHFKSQYVHPRDLQRNQWP